MNEKSFDLFQKDQMYEGTEPYVFISYSHQDVSDMLEITRLFKRKNIRFWYDNGLHSGDDWNLAIAEHLEKAAVCLLLLSSTAASSFYVKNELNFAINHRIPIHTLLLENFKLPIDVEMMLGRIQMIEKNIGYELRLIEALPSELYILAGLKVNNEERFVNHPLFTIDAEVLNKQGTVSFLGHHRTLGYEVLVQEDNISNANETALQEQIRIAGRISHPLFPKIYDIVIQGDSMLTYQAYRKEKFLDGFLTTRNLKETEILSWMETVIDAMDYLFSLNLGLRDFSRGSMVVCDDEHIGMFRLQNTYYGLVKLQQENKQYYFENEVQEIGVLLYQLCTREIPVLPFRMIKNSEYSMRFIDIVNLVVQKCSKENHRIQYNSFNEMKKDLKLKRLSISDIRFLRLRQSKLKRYEETKAANLEKAFTSNEVVVRKNSLEEEFGLDSTVVLRDHPSSGTPVIELLICSTGQVLEFTKDVVLIGRSSECDMILKQPTVSRIHSKLSIDASGNYYVEDMNTANGTHITEMGKSIRIAPGQKAQISKGDIITVGNIKIQIR